MRVKIFFLYLFFQMLGFGNVVHAFSHENHSAMQSLVSSSKEAHLFQSISHTLSLTTAEFDLEEELSSSENFKNPSSRVSYVNDFLPQTWYHRYSCATELCHFDKKNTIFAPFYGPSKPIYIILQVLRI